MREKKNKRRSIAFFTKFGSISRKKQPFREAEGEASPQSPPAGALLLKEGEKKKEKEKKHVNTKYI